MEVEEACCLDRAIDVMPGFKSGKGSDEVEEEDGLCRGGLTGRVT